MRPTTLAATPVSLPGEVLPNGWRPILSATLATLPELIVGAPFWLKWSVTASADILPEQSRAFLWSSCILELRDAAGRIVSRSGTGASGASRRYATMAAMWGRVWPEDALDLPAGEYEMRLLLPWLNLWDPDSSSLRHVAATTTVRVRGPTDQERAFLSKFLPLVSLYSGQVPVPPPLSEAPPTLRDVIGMQLEVHRLLFSPVAPVNVPREAYADEAAWLTAVIRGELAQFDPDTIGRGLPDFYRPAIGVLRYELLLARRQLEAARDVRVSVLKELPGCDWLFRNIVLDDTEMRGPIHSTRGGIALAKAARLEEQNNRARGAR
jgi:hypothetical protein